MTTVEEPPAPPTPEAQEGALTQIAAEQAESDAIKSHDTGEVKKPWYVRYPLGAIWTGFGAVTTSIFLAKKFFNLVEGTSKLIESGKVSIGGGKAKKEEAHH